MIVSGLPSNVGTLSGTPLDDRDYRVPFPFTGQLNKLTIAVDEPVPTEQDRKVQGDAQRGASRKPVHDVRTRLGIGRSPNR